MLHFLLFLLQAWIFGGETDDVFGVPYVRGLLHVLVAVDFGLFVGPVGKWGCVRPHGYLGGYVNQFEVAGHGFPFLVGFAVLDANLEECIVEAFSSCDILGNGGEFLVGWVIWRCDVVGKEDGICDYMPEPNLITVVYGVTNDGWISRIDDLPVIVRVIVWVACNLLALRGDTSIVIAKRVPIRMAVQENPRVFVLHGNHVAILNTHTLHRHDIIRKRLLELRCHEIIARSRTRQNRKMHLEPEEIQQEGHDDQPHSPRKEVLPKVNQTQRALSPIHIQQIPQLKQHRHTHR